MKILSFAFALFLSTAALADESPFSFLEVAERTLIEKTTRNAVIVIDPRDIVAVRFESNLSVVSFMLSNGDKVGERFMDDEAGARAFYNRVIELMAE